MALRFKVVRFKYILSVLILSLSAFLACRSNPAAPTLTGDKTVRVLTIMPDSTTVTIGTKVTFTLSPGTTPFPKPFMITWGIDTVKVVQASVDTLAFTFMVLGKHAISAIYTDSTGTKRDSAKTIITVDSAVAPPVSGLGAFYVEVNHDTLDRSKYATYCAASANYVPSNVSGHTFSLTLAFSRKQLNGPDGININLTGGVTGPVPATYPIVAYGQYNGFIGTLDTGGIEFASLAGGSFTITKFDTAGNLVSGSFHLLVAKSQPTPDPNMVDTINGSFSDVGIATIMFGQGSFSANTNGIAFQPNVQAPVGLEVSNTLGNHRLTIDALETIGSKTLELTLTINTPQLGTFTPSNGETPGTVYCVYSDGTNVYSTRDPFTTGSLTITAFDPINRRLSGTFNFTPGIYNTSTTVQITGGVIDSVQWMQE
jgi:hypothetical protein